MLTQEQLRSLKPYVLARIHHGVYGHAYVGELLSLPTPAQTIMVRRVPGEPGTLEEIPIKKVELDDRLRRGWLHYATVAGAGSFPVDMLRYDRAVPLNFHLMESANYGYRAEHPDPAFGYDDQLVIANFSDRSTPCWTFGRWSSFCWSARHIRTERFVCPSFHVPE